MMRKSEGNKKKSVFKNLEKIRRALFLLAILLLLSISVAGIFQLKANKEYQQIKETFRIINRAVLDKSFAADLIDYMKKYKYDYTVFENALKSNQMEVVAEQIREFAKHMTSYEQKMLTNRFRSFMWSLASYFFLFAFIYFLFELIYRQVISQASKTYNTIKNTYESLYIDKIPQIEPEVSEEDAILNELVREANLRYDIVQYFRSLPYVETLEDYVKVIGEHVCGFFDAGRFSFALVSGDLAIAESVYFVEKDKVPFLDKGFAQKLDETSLGRIIKEDIKYRIIKDLRTVDSISAKLIVKEGFLSNITVPAVVNNRVIGFLFLSASEPNHFTEEDGKLFYIIPLLVSPKLYHALTLQKIIANLGGSFLDLVEYRDNETGNHIKRVAEYSRILAQALKLEPKLVREIYEFSPLHDLGKVGIPDRILLKPGKLDENEWEIMKKHVGIGEMILKNFAQNSQEFISEKALQTAINILADHHEKWDGSGYPRGKKGEEISIEGRIVAIADVFDALTTKRPYKNAFSFEDSVKIIQEQAGKHFDPKLVELFLENLDKIYNIYNELKDVEEETVKIIDSDEAKTQQ